MFNLQKKQTKERLLTMNSLLEKSMNFNKKIKINFNGGDLTSDSGLLLYKEFDKKIGFSETIKKIFKVNDTAKSRFHSNEDILIQKIYQSIAGYFNDDDGDELRVDPAFTEILGKKALASQPTMSRFNNRLSLETIKQLEKINEILMDYIYSIKLPEQIILDLDSTNFQTYGKQYGSAYNFHYSSTGYHPLLMFDGLTGDLLKAELRSGNVYTSRQVVRFIGPVLKKYLKKYPQIARFIRADSGFAQPYLYQIIEQLKSFYAIRLKANANLYKNASSIADRLDNICKKNIYDYAVVYGEFTYKASKWDKSRRVVVKIEKPEGQLCYNYTFVVTNMTSTPKKVIMFYCNRGTMENFIKEGKNGFAFNKMSSSSFVANANRLQQMVLAYNFNNWFRRLCLSDSMKSSRIETIRMKLIKIAGKVVNTSRYIKFKLCSSCPYKDEFWFILEQINALHPSG